LNLATSSDLKEALGADVLGWRRRGSGFAEASGTVSFEGFKGAVGFSPCELFLRQQTSSFM
jgi:hypothetical protein